MQIKLLEVRDRAAFLPVFALSTEAANEAQLYLLRRCGFDPAGDAVILARLNGEDDSSADAYHWGDRTMQTAHLHIQENFSKLRDGDVVDVEFILGESSSPKISEKLEVL